MRSFAYFYVLLESFGLFLWHRVFFFAIKIVPRDRFSSAIILKWIVWELCGRPCSFYFANKFGTPIFRLTAWLVWLWSLALLLLKGYFYILFTIFLCFTFCFLTLANIVLIPHAPKLNLLIILWFGIFLLKSYSYRVSSFSFNVFFLSRPLVSMVPSTAPSKSRWNF